MTEVTHQDSVRRWRLVLEDGALLYCQARGPIRALAEARRYPSPVVRIEVANERGEWVAVEGTPL
jgi:hypothetical protein